MAKYNVYLKSGSVLRIEADMVTSNEAFVHFYTKAPETANSGSFPTDAIFGFYSTDKVEITSPVKGINHAG
jgi:hypothetical protein